MTLLRTKEKRLAMQRLLKELESELASPVLRERETFWSLIQEAKELMGLSRAELAALLGVRRSTVARWLTKRHAPLFYKHKPIYYQLKLRLIAKITAT